MPHSLRAKLSGLRYKGILEDKDYKRLCHALDLEKAEQEQKSGKWIEKEDDTCWWYACSECEQEPLKNRWNDDDVLSAFCPNCGAKMESEDKE